MAYDSTACSSPPTSSYPYAFNTGDNLTTNNGSAQQFNTADQLCWTVSGTSGNVCGSVPTGGTAYNYDAQRNRASAVPSTGSATCDTYDQLNRLTQIQTGTGSSCTSPTTVGTYAYDGAGMRESKTVAGTTTQFVWGGSALLQEKAGSGTPVSYLYGPGGARIEQITGSTTLYLHHDQIGSTRLITDSAGATGTATTITYDPYGDVVTTSGSLTTNLKFCGQYADAESGLYYLRARYYDPRTAQFLSLDPMVATTMSPYAYVAGNPLNASDASGLKAGNATCLVHPKAPSCVNPDPAGLNIDFYRCITIRGDQKGFGGHYPMSDGRLFQILVGRDVVRIAETRTAITREQVIQAISDLQGGASLGSLRGLGVTYLRAILATPTIFPGARWINAE